MSWSRRQILQVGGLAVFTGLAGCTSLPYIGTIGFVLRNYTKNDYNARIEIRLAGQIAFKQTYQLPVASGADPYVLTESKAVSNIPNKTPYTVSLFLDGAEVETLKATMDCTNRDSEPMDEEIDIDIGFGASDAVDIDDSSC